MKLMRFRFPAIKKIKPGFVLIFMIAILFNLSPGFASTPHTKTKKELLAIGGMWITTSTQWKAEKKFHQKRMDRIKSMRTSDIKKEYLLKRELTRHMKRSHVLAAKRDQIQNVLIMEANARVKNSKGAVSGQLTDTAGTKFGEKGHRAMAGDRDMGGGSNTVKKVEDVLQDMGLYNPKNKNASVLDVDSKAGTLEIKGDFELTINKEGLKPKAGTQYHQIQVEADARNPETYVSESMKTRSDGKLVKQQIGTEYVEVQDHRKKATKGLSSDGDGLVRHPDKMQGMAKGTRKTLDMGRVNDETLGKILKQNGITDSPVEFKKKLRGIKEELIIIDNPKVAERMRRASEDVFAAAEKATFKQAKRDIVDLRAKAAAKPPNDPVRRSIEEEIVDTVAKMKQTKAVNDEILSAGPARKKVHILPDNPPAKAAITVETTDIEIKNIGTAEPPSVKQKATKAFGAVMQIADIGQTCQTVEDYMEGKTSLGEATVTIVDQYVTQGVIGTGKHVGMTAADYLTARKNIQKANQNNMTAYLTQWEVSFRKAGMTKEEAKKYVGNALLSGDLDILERKARILRAQGEKIESPTLVTESFEADDTLLERTKNLGKGMATGIYDSVSYPVLAPSRVVEAYSEGMLAEAHLDAYAKTRTASSRSAVFQKLVSAGVGSRQALSAINAYESNDTAPLKKLFKETRERIKAEEAAAAAEAKKADKEIQAQVTRIEAGLKQYMVYIDFLRTTPLTLNHQPLPIELPGEGESVLVEFTLDNPQDNYLEVARSLEKAIEDISGAPGKVMINYKFLIPGKRGQAPNTWFSKSPKTGGIYPVTAEIEVSVKGPGLVDILSNLNLSFTRDAFSSVEVGVNGAEYDYSKGIWPELRKTQRISVGTGAFNYNGKVGAGGTVSFNFKGNIAETIPYTGHVQIQMSPDGKMIKEMIIESTIEAVNQNPSKEKYIYQNLELTTLKKETSTQPVFAMYQVDDEKNNYIWGTFQEGNFKNGEYIWGKIQTTGNIQENPKAKVHLAAPSVVFQMDIAAFMKKNKKKDELKAEKKESENLRKQAAQGGRFYKGPMGKDEGFDGEIQISIGKDNRTVAGKFKCIQDKEKGDKEIRLIIEGEFLGTLTPDTGELATQVNKGSTFQMVKKEGRWYPVGSPKGVPKEMKLMGHINGKIIKGYLIKGTKKSFAWTATPAKTEEN